MKKALIILIIFHIFYFFPFYFTDAIIAQRDLPFLQIPLRFEAIDMWKRGVFPFWTDKISNGFPLLADPHSNVFYPFVFPLIFIKTLKAFTFFMLIHHLIYSIGLFIFANSILKKEIFSLILSISLTYNGIILEFFTFSNPLVGIAYLPWCLYFFYKHLKDDKKINLVISSILFALSILAGFDLAPFLFSFSIFLLLIFLKSLKIFKALLCIFIAFLFSSPQTFPTLFYMPHSQRNIEKNYENSKGFYSLHPFRFLDTFIPNFNGVVKRGDKKQFWADGISDRSRGLYPVPYFGIFFVLLVFSVRPFERKWLFISFFLFFTLLSFGRYFPLHYYFSKIPIIEEIRYPEKFLVFLIFFFYFFMCFSLSNLKKISVFPALMLTISLLSLLLLNEISSNNLIKSYISSVTYQEVNVQVFSMKKNLLLSFGISLTIFIIFYLSNKYEKLKILFPFFCFLDLFYVTSGNIKILYEGKLNSPLVNILKEEKPVRILYVDIPLEDPEYCSSKKNIFELSLESLQPDFGILFGLNYSFSRSIDAMNPKISHRENFDQSDLLNWGISHIILLCRKWNIGETILRFEEYELKRLNKDATFIWFLNEKKKIAIPLRPLVNLKNPSNFKIKVKNDDEGILWVGYNNLPGWKVYINGKKDKIYNEKLSALNVFLKPGVNEIKFVYFPPGLMPGVILFISGLIFCVIILKWKKVEKE